MISIQQCPICQNKKLSPFITCEDYTVSHEKFNLLKCNNCNLLITSPRPENLNRYYESTEYLSHEENNNSFFANIYRAVRKKTTNSKTDLVRSLTPNQNPTILDIGCGTGTFLSSCQKAGMIVTGVEPSDKARSAAERKTGTKIEESVSRITGSFDLITLWHVLEHLPDLNEQMDLLTGKLKSEGYLILAVPNHESSDAVHYQEKWAAYDVPRHLWHFSQQSMKNLLIKNKLRLHQIIPMKMDAYYVSMLSEKYKSGNLGPLQMTKGIINGLRSNLNSGKEKNYSSLIYIAQKNERH